MPVVSTQTHERITRLEFDNRFILLTHSNPFLPIVSLRGSFRCGASEEAESQSGMTRLMTGLMKSGTASRDAVRIAEETDFLGTSIRFSPHPDAVHFSMSCLKKHLGKSLELLTDLVFHSIFPDDEVERVRSASLADLKRKLDQPAVVSWEVFNRHVYDSHPYGRTLDGTDEGLRAIRAEELRERHACMVTGRELILAIAGDVEAEETRRALLSSEWCGSRTGLSEDRVSDVPSGRARRVFLVDRDLTQANLCLGNLAAKRRSPDHAASTVMSYILGGSGLVSRLTNRIRTREGLAYSVYSSMTKRRLGGTFSIHMQTKSETAERAVRIILEEIKRMQDEPVTAEEFDDAKRYFKGSMPFRIQTNSSLALHMEQSEFHQLGLDYMDRELQDILALDRDAVRDAAQKYLEPDRFTLAVAGRAGELAQPLEGFACVERARYPL
jgi:zinc protease